MWITTFVLFSYFTIITVVISQDDPCLEGNYIELNQWERSVANDVRKGICDNFLPSGWYRPISLAGNTMPTECIQGGFRCGTTSTLWMNGSYPSVGEVSNATACASNYNGGCCISSYDIQVKNCGDYYVYNLTHTHGCYEAYCFGTETKCPKGETSDNDGFTPGCEYDPCLEGNYIELNQWERSVANDIRKGICDNFLPSGWYRPISLAGNTMPTECIQGGFRCGTTSTLWMNGSYPSVGEVSNVTACASNYNGGCCISSYDIQVKNCGDYYVYNLTHTHGCYEAYCFGKETKCSKGETSDNGGFTPGCEFDPCQSVNYKVLRMEMKRSANYSLNDDDTAIEDSRLNTGWYRIDSVTGNDIVNQSVSMMHCGTVYPLWMEGTIPEVSDKTVDRKVCKSGLSSMCEAEYDIKVRNCGNYRTYFLQQLTVDKTGYCFGSLPVPTPPTTMKPPDRDSTDKEDGERSNSSVWAVVCILAVISLLLVVIIVLQICKKNTKQERSIDSVPEKTKIKYAVNVNSSPPPAYEEKIQNEKNSYTYNERVNNHNDHFDSFGGIPTINVRSRPNFIEARPPQSTRMEKKDIDQ